MKQKLVIGAFGTEESIVRATSSLEEVKIISLDKQYSGDRFSKTLSFLNDTTEDYALVIDAE